MSQQSPMYQSELYRTECLLGLDIKFCVYPAVSGKVEPNSGGLKLEPDFPAQVDITGVFLSRDTKQKKNLLSMLTSEEIESLEADISEALEI